MKTIRIIQPSSIEEAFTAPNPPARSVTMPVVLHIPGKPWSQSTKVGLLKRAKDPYQNGQYPFAGMWELGGGVVESNEDPRVCVIREVKEERALVIPLSLPQFVGIYPYTSRGAEVGNWLFYLPVDHMPKIDWNKVQEPKEHDQENWDELSAVLTGTLAFKHWEALAAMSWLYGDKPLQDFVQHQLEQRQMEIVFEKKA